MSAASRGGWRLAALYAACAALVLLPLAFAAVPPLVDYPNHLARAYILADAGQTADVAANYRVAWRIVPYLAQDAAMVALSALMSVESAGRVFIALAMLSPLLGAAVLHRVLHGRFTAWPLASLLGVYSFQLYFGFIDGLFMEGLALAAFAGWLVTGGWPLWRRVPVFALVALALMFGHLFAFALYGLLVGSRELAALWPSRRSLRAILRTGALGLHGVPPLILWLTAFPAGRAMHTEFGGLNDKLLAVLSPFMFGYQPTVLDELIWMFGLLTLLIGLRRGVLRLDSRLRAPFFAVLLAAVAMPTWLNGVWSSDSRLPPVLVLLLIAGSQPRGVPARLGRAVVLAGAALLSARVATAAVMFDTYDQAYAAFRSLAENIPRGARLMMVAPSVDEKLPPFPGWRGALLARRLEPFWHMPALAVLDRAAYFPALFTVWKALEVAPRNAGITSNIGMPLTPDELNSAADPATASQAEQMVNQLGESPYWRHWPADFDAVLWLSFHPDTETVPANLRRIARSDPFTLYGVVR